MAAWAGFESEDSGFTERARAQIRDGALYRPPRYREVEPWAWARLMQRMRAIKTRRAKLRPAAA
jgi:hypothetical protein